MASAVQEFDPTQHVHRRCAYIGLDTLSLLDVQCLTDNPLTDEYVVISPHRSERPWLGQIESPQPQSLPQYDPSCYLCPGNQRAGGIANPSYTNTYSFLNDFAALAPASSPSPPKTSHPLLTTYPVHGRCDVLCFHPRHDLTVARLAPADIIRIIDEWVRIYRERSMEDDIQYVQIFEA